jgi:hypothetical protein
VVTSRRAGAAELLEGALGGLVVADPEDLPALGTAVERALGPDGPELGRLARVRAEAFPWDAHVARVDAFLTEVGRGA